MPLLKVLVSLTGEYYCQGYGEVIFVSKQWLTQTESNSGNILVELQILRALPSTPSYWQKVLGRIHGPEQHMFGV